MRNYDVIITGARVAGATLAWHLAKSGFRVLLLDKASFPSDTLSTHNFLTHSMVMLEEMGVLEALLHTGTPPYKRAVIQFDDAVIDGCFPEVEGYSDCLCIRRHTLDEIMFRHTASQPNVTAIESFRVTGLLREGIDGAVSGVEGVRGNGERLRFRAKLVVGADGRQSKIRELAGGSTLISVPTDFASYVGYYADYKQEGEPHTELYKLGDKLGIVFPTGDNLHVVGVMFPLTDSHWRARFLASPSEAMQEIVRDGYAGTPLARRLGTARLSGQVRGLLGYTNDWHQGMGEGWALVGDALSFKDPAVGQGMPDAMYSAKLLVEVLNEYAGRWEVNWQRMAEAYQQKVEDKMMSRFRMACQFTKNVPFTPQERFVNALVAASPGATSAFLGIYNHAVEPEQFQAVVAKLLQEQGA
ncbi:NAD(P)/FAD-dependent oxidoreductase [Paenibacillus sp. 1P07SE]|uniref:NAD(P)/FAD-dependent oxidoreductase n=1 Tax=Paenibacillus sp. 1P07SE TaxID=3132209 RepID=UPI0039A6C449